jgi:hypothetical protein
MIVIAAAAVIGALTVPITLTSTTQPTAPTASAAVTTPVQQVDPAARAIAGQQHVTLAQAELRLSWQQAVPSLNAALSSQLSAAVLGGIWIAPNDGDRVKVGVVSSDPRTLAIAARAVRAAGLSAATDLVHVRYSAKQLQNADAWLGSQLNELTHGRTTPIGLYSDYRMDLNRVQLGVAGHGLTTAERTLISRATARYGDLVQIVTQPDTEAVGTSLDCTYPYCFPPLRGGISITSTNGIGVQAQCTGAFIASSRTDGKLYQFTAGHCVAEGSFTGTWSTKFPDGSTHAVGPVHNYTDGPSGDMAILAINNPSGWQLPQGWVYVTANSGVTTLNEEYPISSAQYSTQGARVCKSGAAYGKTTCGTVTALGVNYQFLQLNGLVTVDNMGEANFCGTAGDSGGPVFAAHQAFGLLIGERGRNSCDLFYQGIVGAENAMHVNIVPAH